MKTIKLTIAVTAAVLLLSACSTTIQTDFDTQADFSKYSSYAWFIKPEKNKPPTAGANQIVDRRIRRAIAGQLASKGFSETSAERADFLVTYYVSLSQQIRMYPTGWGYGWGPYWGFGYGWWPGWGYGGTYVYNEGTIIVDVIDQGRRQLVWRGVVSRALSKSSSSQEKIDKAIARLMRGFPPE